MHSIIIIGVQTVQYNNYIESEEAQHAYQSAYTDLLDMPTLFVCLFAFLLRRLRALECAWLDWWLVHMPIGTVGIMSYLRSIALDVPVEY